MEISTASDVVMMPTGWAASIWMHAWPELSSPRDTGMPPSIPAGPARTLAPSFQGDTLWLRLHSDTTAWVTVHLPDSSGAIKDQPVLAGKGFRGRNTIGVGQSLVPSCSQTAEVPTLPGSDKSHYRSPSGHSPAAMPRSWRSRPIPSLPPPSTIPRDLNSPPLHIPSLPLTPSYIPKDPYTSPILRDPPQPIPILGSTLPRPPTPFPTPSCHFKEPYLDHWPMYGAGGWKGLRSQWGQISAVFG